MDQKLQSIVVDLAARKGALTVTRSFNERIDAYLGRADVARLPEAQKRIVAAFLCSAAIRIAREDHKTHLEAEDAKAAIWLFHLPKDENDPSINAAINILKIGKPRQKLGAIDILKDDPMKPGMFVVEAELQEWLQKEPSLDHSAGMQGLDAG